MKKNRWLLAGVVAGISALAVSSCAYDPYYSGGSYSSGYGGYGDGYGYGGSGFSTSFFVSTGSPRWGYDPYAGAYYDYTRRCYYDPYLSGYYPRGYRPRYVYGSPHPHGWSRGRGYIAPPNRVRSYNLTSYQNRTERYRSLGRDWSRNVSTAPSGRNQVDNYDRIQNPQQQRDGGRRFNQPTPNDSGRNRFNRGDNDGNNRREASGFDRRNVAPQPPVSTRSEGSFRGGRMENPGASPPSEAPPEFTSPRIRPETQVVPPTRERVRPQPQRQQPSGDDGRRSRGGDGGRGRSEEGRGGRSRGPIGLGEG